MTPEDRGIWLHLLTQDSRHKQQVAASAFDHEFPRGLTHAQETEGAGQRQQSESGAEGSSHGSEQGPATGEAPPPMPEAATAHG